MSSILFSPIGTSDPIRGLYDGPWLHICRMRRPHLTVLFQSRMIAAYDALGFYDHALDYLNKALYDNDTDRYIRMEKQQDTTCESAHDYNLFMKPFTETLRTLHDRFPEDELLVNASSGTPAMQITLMYLHLMGDIPFTLLQVVNPEHEHSNNKRIDEKYNVEDAWETDLDNEPDCADRCVPLCLTPYVMMNRMDSLKNLIRREDYAVAEAEMTTILPFFFADQVKRLKVERAIRGAALRTRLEIDRAASSLQQAGYSLCGGMAKKRTAAFNCAEYLRIMQHDISGGSLDMFMLRISPVLSRLCVLYLMAKGTLLQDAGIAEEKGRYVWRPDLMPPEICDVMKAADRDLTRLREVSTHTLLPVLHHLCPPQEVAVIEKLRTVELQRNAVAHDMMSSGQAGSEQWVMQHTRLTCADILDLLWQLMAWVDADIASAPRDYLDMDAFILSLLG